MIFYEYVATSNCGYLDKSDNNTIFLDDGEETLDLDHHELKKMRTVMKMLLGCRKKKLMEEVVYGKKDTFKLYNEYAYAVVF